MHDKTSQDMLFFSNCENSKFGEPSKETLIVEVKYNWEDINKLKGEMDIIITEI